MAANIDAVALVRYRARDAAHVFAAFENDGLDVGPFQQLVRRRQSRRTRADDDRAFLMCVRHSGETSQWKLRLRWYQSEGRRLLRAQLTAARLLEGRG